MKKVLIYCVVCCFCPHHGDLLCVGLVPVGEVAAVRQVERHDPVMRLKNRGVRLENKRKEKEKRNNRQDRQEHETERDKKGQGRLGKDTNGCA